MPTETKPKRPVDPYMIPVTISEAHKALLLECVNINPATDPERAGQLISGVEMNLTWNFNMLRRVPGRPLPPHIIAALKPIAKKAAELAALLNPADLPVAVLRELDVCEVDNGKAWHLLTGISGAASMAILRLKEQNSTGLHRRQSSVAMEQAVETLARVFDQFANDPAVGDKGEFIKICRKYFPKPAKPAKTAKP